MTDFVPAFDLFHFLRPWWFLALPMVLAFWWLARKRDSGQPKWAGQIASHLLGHLLVNKSRRLRFKAVDLASGVAILSILAAAGPTWTRIASPLFSNEAPVVVVLELSDTMRADDVAPTRLERAKLKVLDLIAARRGSRTGIVAYAGSAHLVLPTSDDPGILKSFIEGLDASVMPTPGQDAGKALALADRVLAREKTPGTILFVNDGIDPADLAAFGNYARADGSYPVIALVLGTQKGGRLRNSDGSFSGPAAGTASTGVSPALLDRWGSEGDVRVVRSTADQRDVGRLERLIRSNLQSAIDADEASNWREEGWWLIWPALFAALAWFRRGWSMQWVWIFAVAIGVGSPGTAQADGLKDWFFTPDQQGRSAFEENRFAEAGALFEDPMWRGIALYRAGKYLEAAEVFARIQSPDGLYNMGNALVKGREYDQAVAAYEQVLEEDPEHEAARHNLSVARAVIAYLNRVRQAEDTGDQTELGADEYKFDNKSGEGKEIVITGRGKLKLDAVDQWMRTVNTEMRDFLKTKFRIEASQGDRR